MHDFFGIFASWVPYNDLDSFRGHLFIGTNFFSLVDILTWDIYFTLPIHLIYTVKYALMIK